MRRIAAALAMSAGALLFFTSPAAAQAAASFSGQVVSVHDGDTLTVAIAGGARRKVRLAEIDAPECGQPGSVASRNALRRLVLRHQVTVIPESVDEDAVAAAARKLTDLFVGRPHQGPAAATSFDRLVGWVTVGSPAIDVGSALVQAGAVWVNPRFVRRPELLSIQRTRRAERRGLWSLQDGQLTPPWIWRESHPPARGECGK